MERASEGAPSTRDEEDSKGSSCPICLDSMEDEAFLDRCFHAFCRRCIAHWSKTVAENHSQSIQSIRCPLCKRENFSILHDVSIRGFRQQYINQDPENSFFSRAHIVRWRCYHGNPGNLGCKLNVPKFWKCQHYLKRNSWLELWLRREMQALTQEMEVDIIVHHVLGVIESFLKRQDRERSSCLPEKKRSEFRALVADAARPFVSEQTDRFVDEIEFFMVSRLNIEAYDKMYVQCMDFGNSGSMRPRSNQGDGEAAILDFFKEDLDETG